MEFVHDAWASDRKADWSIWMVYSEVEMPNHLLSAGDDESSYQGTHGKALSLRKSSVSEDVININFHACSTFLILIVTSIFWSFLSS